MAGTQKGRYVKLPLDFEADVVPNVKKYKTFKFAGVHISWDWRAVYLRYAGDNAVHSYTTFELPPDPETLRALAKQLSELAQELDDE